MGESRLQKAARDLLAQAGVRPDGDNPWDPQIHDQRWYARVFSGGSLALGESYVDGWWNCAALDQFIDRVLRADLDRKVRGLGSLAWLWLAAWLMNRQSRARAGQVAKAHYDLGNDLFRVMLDRRMIYSCAWWQQARDLNQAQEAKLELICRKLRLEPGMSLLDIGCGWGGLAQYAASRHGVRVVGVTVSQPQAELARQVCAGLPVDIRLQDYRGLDEGFDRIASVGMFEHVGPRNYRTFMEIADRCLAEDGLFLLHTIGRGEAGVTTEPWIEKYIFPNGVLPSPSQIARAAEGLFIIEDWHSFGGHYDQTLMAWHDNFNQGWPELQERYGQRFQRLWSYYLLSCAGAFRARSNLLWQVVFSKRGREPGYQSQR